MFLVKKEPLVFKSKKIDLEYGNKISNNLEDYIDIEQSDEAALKKTILDVSQVKNVIGKGYPRLGLHTLRIIYDKESYEIEINVKDTKRPIFTNFRSNLKFVKGKKPKKEELLKFFTITDVDAVNVSIDDSHVDYNKVGEYKATISASDSTHNQTTKDLKIYIVEPAVQFVDSQIKLELWSQKRLGTIVNVKNGKVNYSSTNDNVISVNKNGIVTAKKKGTANVIAIVNGEKTKCKIIVNQPNIRNYKQAEKYLLNYLKAKGKYIPLNNEFDHVSEQGYVIHGYDMGKDFTFTNYWYTVSQNGDIYDEILLKYIHKN